MNSRFIGRWLPGFGTVLMVCARVRICFVADVNGRVVWAAAPERGVVVGVRGQDFQRARDCRCLGHGSEMMGDVQWYIEPLGGFLEWLVRVHVWWAFCWSADLRGREAVEACAFSSLGR